MSVLDVSQRQPRRAREQLENTIAGFSIASTLGLLLVGWLMLAPLFS